MKGTKEFCELMNQFEKDVSNLLYYGHKVERVGRDEKVPPDQFYQDGYVNMAFRAYMYGYQFGKAVQSEVQDDKG